MDTIIKIDNIDTSMNMKNLRKYARHGFAIGGLFFICAVILWVAIMGASSNFIYFPNQITAGLIHVWLGSMFIDHFLSGTSKKPVLSHWTENNQKENSSLFIDVTFHFVKHLVVYITAIILLSWGLRIPLTVLGGIIVAIGFSSFKLTFELSAWWIATKSDGFRRTVRLIFFLLVIITLCLWAWKANSRGLFPGKPQIALLQLITVSVWWWFLPTICIMRILELLSNGGNFLLYLFPSLCSTIFLTIIYIRHSDISNKDIGNNNEM